MHSVQLLEWLMLQTVYQDWKYSSEKNKGKNKISNITDSDKNYTSNIHNNIQYTFQENTILNNSCWLTDLKFSKYSPNTCLSCNISHNFKLKRRQKKNIKWHNELLPVLFWYILHYHYFNLWFRVVAVGNKFLFQL